MENLTKNLPNITMEAMEEDEKNSNKNPNSKGASIFDAKNYLNTKLDIEKGETSKELRVRLLPIDGNSSTPFKKIYVHQVRVPKEVSATGYKSYICLEKTEGIDHDKYGHKCPFCELNREAYKKSVEATNQVDKKRFQETSLANIANEACIMRLIDRDAEGDGPKFWKFNIRLDKKDPKNIIKLLYNSRLKESREDGEELNILDIYKGKDLKITISKVESRDGDSDKKKNNKTSINIIDCGKIKPLSTDEETIRNWIFDKKKWSDVFSIKPYDYLAIIINGGIPWYDRDNNRWVSKDDYNSNKDIEVKKIDDMIQESNDKLKNENNNLMDQVTIKDDDDDLPF